MNERDDRLGGAGFDQEDRILRYRLGTAMMRARERGLYKSEPEPYVSPTIARFEKEVDPEHKLSNRERAIRAEYALLAHRARVSLVASLAWSERHGISGELTEKQKTLRARAGAYASLAKGKTNTGAARKASFARFEREVDPEGTLPQGERQRLAKEAERAFMNELRLRKYQKGVEEREAKARADRRRRKREGG